MAIVANLNLIFFSSFLFYHAEAGYFNVVDFGAISGGQVDASKAFLSAWADACASVVPATIYVPAGKYLINPIVLNGPCNNAGGIAIQIDGILVAPSNYGSALNWLLFDSVSGVSISGGLLDGQGTALWACKAGKGNCPVGAMTLHFNNAKDIVISNLISVNSELFHIAINNCQNVTLQGVRINAPGNSPNTDGIHVEQSMDVRIFSTGIKTGDDCISIGPGTKNLWIEHVACGPGHGISIGSLGKETVEQGVQNVTVKNVVLTGTMNGLRIKSWARQSTGFVNGVVFQHVLMQNVNNPLIIDQHYCPDDNQACPNQNSGIKISQIRYKNIKGTSASKIAMKFDCSLSSPCQGIALEDIKLTYQDQPALSSCQNAVGTTTGSVIPQSCL